MRDVQFAAVSEVAEMLEPRPGLEPGTCRFLQPYRGTGSKSLFPHLTSRYRAVFGSNCPQVVRSSRSIGEPAPAPKEQPTANSGGTVEYASVLTPKRTPIPRARISWRTWPSRDRPRQREC